MHPTPPPATSSHSARAPRLTSAAALWASAAVIFAMVIVQAGRFGPLTPAARADLVSQSGQYTILTFNAGSDDVVAVLDGRGEELFLYQVRQRQRLEFIGREDLRTLFTNARVAGGGRR